jgi:hypothetical protein
MCWRSGSQWGVGCVWQMLNRGIHHLICNKVGAVGSRRCVVIDCVDTFGSFASFQKVLRGDICETESHWWLEFEGPWRLCKSVIGSWYSCAVLGNLRLFRGNTTSRECLSSNAGGCGSLKFLNWFDIN